MSASTTQILHRELERLSGAFSIISSHECATARGDDIEALFQGVASLRSSVRDVVRRYTNELSKDELIGLHSNLDARLDELLSIKVKTLVEQRTRELADQAERDPVTTLRNRAAFNRKLHDEIERARRYERELSLVMFDVDCFKSVNDQFGHPAGDRVLAQVARQLESSLRKTDAVFRYGGDEFAAICPETSGDVMINVLRRLESNIRDWRVESHLSKQLGLSCGIASFPADASNENVLIAIADQRLYACKRLRHRRLAAGL